jgi:hypothetical protein
VQDTGGATQSTSGQKETQPLQDACPPGYPTSGTNACKGQVDGAGGDGGPGVIQLHTSNGLIGTAGQPGVDIILPSTVGVTLREICAPPPLCADNLVGSPTAHMVPTFGRLSHARSNWIALGNGGFDRVTSTYNDVSFAFGGVDTVTGFVQTDVNGNVTALAPLLGPSVLDPNQVNPPFVLPGSNDRQMVIDASPLLGTNQEALLQNTKLLTHYMIELSQAGSFLRFDVVAASYDANSERLTLTVDGSGPAFSDFSSVTPPQVTLEPAFFRIRTSGSADKLPSSATVKIQFQAARLDPITGLPTNPTALTSDISTLNVLGNSDLRFIRFEVLFDIAAQGQPLTANNPIPSLEFFRFPFEYQ